MRADRLVSILLLLQNKGKLTTKELANELEVTERTIHRDMEALSTAGIPIVADRGKAGGWRLMEQYRTNLTGLKVNELKSLFLTPSAQLLNDLGLTKDWDEARQKLLASVPSIFQKEAGHVWERIYVDTSTWRQSPQKVESFHTLQEAIWDEKKLQIQYERADGEMVERIVEPLGLVAKGSTWYLIASANGEIRNYRATRIITANLTGETFSRPERFKLAEYWQASTQQFIKALPKYEVDVEMSASIVPRIKFTGKFVKILHAHSPTENGWIPANLCFETEQEACEFILGFGDQIRILSPKALRKTIYKMAKATVEMYEQD
ncbi:predicted DNA-binding transcriptional regulator YafY [Bacillus oleivorans]|uniref:Predicted DNA-binding transcriptional regulator YafY n=1 Tax=Bacillus oleivorans TaxID=1448271 RepID=A0A285CGM9_9BACI|nr:YafY family protein [Bacillus oleivorans]SNX66762.1 predicted DNA-binding transcriptional regulator YafY [Bacillus oleivorans]